MLELIFITSNNEKVAHAQHLCRNYDILISKKKNYGIGYIEPRIDNREELIEQSVNDAFQRFSKSVSNPESKYFFIEDTSVIIVALSREKEFPGVDVKYWMRNNSFESIDNLLKENGNDRNVLVRSDLILFLPKEQQRKYGKKYVSFVSYAKGKITDKEFEIKTQPLYPWLNSRTFNKWFIPDNCRVPISLLPIDEADKHDFRAGAFNEMIKFLMINENIGTGEEKTTIKVQYNLFSPYFFIVSGPPCAGKSTLAAHLNDEYNYYHIEASDYMHLSYYERHGINSTVTIGDFAEAALNENPEIVANQILKDIENLNNTPIIITGFRSPKEIDSLIKQYKGGLPIEIIYIDADQYLRFQRNQLRRRYDAQDSLNDFKLKDEQQYSMGLSLIKEGTSNLISNNKTIPEYLETFEKRYNNHLDSLESLSQISIPSVFKTKHLQNAIILNLEKYGEPESFYTTTEISHLINKNPDFESHQKHKDNISRYFNQNFHPYFEIKHHEGRSSFRLSQTGKAYARWLIRNKID